MRPTDHPFNACSNLEPPIEHQRLEEQFLTTTECAALLRLSPRTLERMRSEGAGPRFVKAGSGLRSRVLYPLADILAWTNARRFRSTSDYVASKA